MALFLIVDFAHHKFVDGALWFRFVGGPELVGPVGFVKRYQPLGMGQGRPGQSRADKTHRLLPNFGLHGNAEVPEDLASPGVNEIG